MIKHQKFVICLWTVQLFDGYFIGPESLYMSLRTVLIVQFTCTPCSDVGSILVPNIASSETNQICQSCYWLQYGSIVFLLSFQIIIELLDFKFCIFSCFILCETRECPCHFLGNNGLRILLVRCDLSTLADAHVSLARRVCVDTFQHL